MGCDVSQTMPPTMAEPHGRRREPLTSVHVLRRRFVSHFRGAARWVRAPLATSAVRGTGYGRLGLPWQGVWVYTAGRGARVSMLARPRRRGGANAHRL